MLKRVELARALVVKPEILYMDEPFSALDALMSLRMRNELLRILDEERHTVLLITHDVEEAIHIADRVARAVAAPGDDPGDASTCRSRTRAKLASPGCRSCAPRSCASSASIGRSDARRVAGHSMCRPIRSHRVLSRSSSAMTSGLNSSRNVPLKSHDQ